MINGSRIAGQPIRWAMVGGGKGSQIGYIHRSAAMRDDNFRLVAAEHTNFSVVLIFTPVTSCL